MILTPAQERFLTRQALGRLATVGSDGTPQVKPVGFTYRPELGAIDVAGFNMGRSAKYRNVATNPKVAFVVDEVTEPTMDGAHFLELRGVARTAVGAHDSSGHLAPEIIRIQIRRVVSFNVDPDHPGFEARNVAVEDGTSEVA
jgi:pyridoxamine 5'-phosphate oxidase family protein